MKLSRVKELEIQEAIQTGLTVPDILKLLGVTHAQVTKERKVLRVGKWARKFRSEVPVTHAAATLLKWHKIRDMLLDSKHYPEIQQAVQCSKLTISRVKNTLKAEGYRFNGRGQVMNLGGASSHMTNRSYFNRAFSAPIVNTPDKIWEKKEEQPDWSSLKPVKHEASSVQEFAKLLVPALKSIEPARKSGQASSEITPLDYVNAFEERVLEYHTRIKALTEDTKRLEQENAMLKADLSKLQSDLTQALYQARNFQPNSLIRTSLSNGG
jgi:uncharacterized protein YerC